MNERPRNLRTRRVERPELSRFFERAGATFGLLPHDAFALPPHHTLASETRRMNAVPRGERREIPKSLSEYEIRKYQENITDLQQVVRSFVDLLATESATRDLRLVAEVEVLRAETRMLRAELEEVRKELSRVRLPSVASIVSEFERGVVDQEALRDAAAVRVQLAATRNANLEAQVRNFVQSEIAQSPNHGDDY